MVGADQDNLLIYYAGHGSLDKEADQGHWLPVDAQRHDISAWIPIATITGQLRAMQAKHVLVVADSCYSGQLTRDSRLGIQPPNALMRLAKKRSRTVMTSGGLEPVIDGGGRDGHSVFASAFMKTLREVEKIADATTLYAKIRYRVMLDTDADGQIPQYGAIRKADHDEGDFLFVRK